MATRSVTLFNPETETAVEVTLSEEDAVRCENDLEFATAILNSALESIPEKPDGDCISAKTEDVSAVNNDEGGLYRWNMELVLLLLDSYVKNEEKFSSGRYSQKKVWEEVAEVMRSKSLLITGAQCAAKMRSLKKTYKSVKDHNNKSGNDRRVWPFYEKMDRIFKKKAWADPVAVASSSGMSVKRSRHSESEVPSDSFLCQNKKETVASLLKKRLQQKAEEEEARFKRHKEKIEMDQKFLDVLNKLVE